MVTRKELIAAIGVRYRVSARAARPKILDEFVGVTGYHRKHAIRVLTREPRSGRQKRSRDRLYDEAVRQALIVLWEAGDRICGKRLKALIPILMGAMERHGRMGLEAEVRARLMGISECLALPVREQTLIVEGFAKARAIVPFAIRGLDADNDSAFMNETVFDFCRTNGIELTRSRAHKKNDQAWVEQKNGAIVRRLVGYGRLSGMAATGALAPLYTVSRLYINYFQPSFKLKSKQRDGARVIKHYHSPMTPCERLLGLPSVEEAIKERLRAQLDQLDPVRLLKEIREAQQELAGFAARSAAPVDQPPPQDVKMFLDGLSGAWKAGEVRPTHRKKSTAQRSWRTRVDPLEHTWPTIQQWLEADPGVSAKDLMHRLAELVPDVYAGTAQLRTLQRRVQAWRRERAMQLVFGNLRRATAAQDVAATAATAPW